MAEDIVNSDVTCTPEEKVTLVELETALEELIVQAETDLEAIQAQLEEETGTTLEIVTTPLPTSPIVTTAAARMRMRGLVNKFMV